MRWLDTRWRRYWTWHNFENVYFSRYTRNQTASINCSSTIFANVTKLRLQRAGYHFLFYLFFRHWNPLPATKNIPDDEFIRCSQFTSGIIFSSMSRLQFFFACELTASHNRKCCLVFVDSTGSGGECTFNYISINFRYFQWLIKKTAAVVRRLPAVESSDKRWHLTLANIVLY